MELKDMEQIPEFANHKYGIDMMDPSRPSSFIFLNPLAQKCKSNGIIFHTCALDNVYNK